MRMAAVDCRSGGDMATAGGSQLDRSQMRRVLFASTVGTAIEWYDYFVYGTVGALIFGHFGDRIGRKATLIATLLLTGIGTFLMGCLPGHDAIGLAAPLFLVVFRVAQG